MQNSCLPLSYVLMCMLLNVNVLVIRIVEMSMTISLKLNILFFQDCNVIWFQETPRKQLNIWLFFYSKFQYSFPPSCVGEVGRIGAPSRREIGHGMLAERALEPILPSEDDFPYTIRVESTITESNGSSRWITFPSFSIGYRSSFH